ncbi:class I SAM-dependent methyltransferase [candidate division WOR-3 bacterium]|nr:class I SAM-dependent methyltransferase [candidate division WOR-3 bacterium]
MATSDPEGAAERYAVSGRKRFWQEIFRRELAYLVEHLKGCSDILSVGCGPAVIEGGLAKRGFNVTGLDVSQEALNRAPDSVRTVAAKAEDMPFPRSSFDAVVYVASLQFIDDYRKAIEKSVYVLRSGGRIIVMLLNPKSEFFKRKSLDPDSYVRRIRHTDLKKIEHVIADNYAIRTEYFLGVKGDAVLADRVAGNAVLYVVSGTKKSLTPASVNA